MTRPVCLVDGSDNKSIIIASHSMRQCLSKDTGLGGGNIVVDFLATDTTDNDEDGNNLLIEPGQAYLASICRLAQIAPTQVIIININPKTGAAFSTNPYKVQIADNTLLFAFRLHTDQTAIRFRFNNMTVNDNCRTTLWKIS